MGDGVTPAQIGPYPVERELGRGGMGIVYLAHDPRLGRPIAIKVLPESVAADAERLARFDREARLLAAVHHPNVASIFAIEEDAGRRYLVLEYVPGQSLADHLLDGPLSIAETLDVARQIAAGLEAAHEAGVIHRDLKPANVRLTPEGAVKVLDFGLAKGGATSSTISSSMAESPTRTLRSTAEGTLLGTLTYMSPEQARGKAVDRRTDVWAFGCLLFHCLSGRSPFDGDTPSDVLARILEREPPWSALPAATPPRLRELLQRCLEKERGRRLRDLGDAQLELEAIAAERSSVTADPTGSPATSRRGWARTAALAVPVALLVALGGGLAGWRIGSSSRPTPLRWVDITIPPEILVAGGELSPSGDELVLLARHVGEDANQYRLYRRSLGGRELAAIPGAEHVDRAFFVDDQQVRFVSRTTGTDERFSYVVQLRGGSPPLPEGVRPADWQHEITLPDGRTLVLVASNTAFVELRPHSRAASAPRRIEAGTNGDFDFTPVRTDEWAILRSMRFTPAGFREGSVVVDIATGKARPLLDVGAVRALTRDGYLLFSRGDTLLAAPFDRDALRIAGPELSLTSGLRVSEAGLGGDFQLGADGTLVFPAGGAGSTEREIVACAPGGTCEPWQPLRRHYLACGDLAPDGSGLAVVLVGRGDNYEVWRLQPNGGLTQLHAAGGRDATAPIWSPDGRSLALAEDAAGFENDGVMLVPLTGEPARRLTPADREWQYQTTAWSPDGSSLLAGRRSRASGRSDVVTIDTRSGAVRALLATPSSEWPLDLSPSGRQLAFVSDQSGVPEAYVANLSAAGTLGTPVPLSRGAAREGRFSRDGRSFFFDDDAGHLRRIELGADGLPTDREPQSVLDLRRERLVGDMAPLSSFRALPDGRLLFVREGADEGDIHRFEVVLGFADEVARRMRARARSQR